MLELKFTINEMEQLIRQNDAEHMNLDKELIVVYQNLYRKEGDYYYNVEQRLKIQNKRNKKSK